MQDKIHQKNACTRGSCNIPPLWVTPLVLMLTLSGCQMSPTDPSNKPEKIVNNNTVYASLTSSIDGSTELNSAEPVEPEMAPLPDDSLIDVIREGLALDLDADNARIRTQLNWYAGNQLYFDRVLERAEPYLHYIVSEIERRDMPMEFALLPMVESAYDPFAYSYARAAGLWQFIPSTGRHYGLAQNWWYDGRRDVMAATNAALTYLQELHGQFNDWELALAAYNSGRGTVANAIRRNRKAQKPTNFWSLKLPKETSAYVPKMLAIGKIFRDSTKYEVTLNAIPNRPYFEQVDIGQQIDLDRAAKLAGIKTRELQLLNPAFSQWATSPDGPHTLLIPIELADNFKASLEKLPPEQRLKWQRYKIVPGDSLSHIANRFGTSVGLIRDINQISGSVITAGKTLLIPVPSGDRDNYVLTAAQRKLAKAKRSRAGRDRVNYVVQNGDSFWDIAKSYDVSVGSLASWNSMAPRDTLRVGQRLVIWKEQTEGSRKGVVRKINYQVRSGDNLSVIADRYKVEIKEIRKWNSLDNKYLQPGDSLTLFVNITGN